jgi:hypothetical protein
MKTKKLLTGAAVLALGVTGAVAPHLAFERQAQAQYGEGGGAEPAQEKSPESGSKKSQPGETQGSKPAGESTAEPDTTTGTRGESGRAGPMRSPDAAAQGAEPQTAPESEKAPAPDKSTGPESLKSPESDPNKRDPLPSGSETSSPTHRQSRPW